ncbi:Unknown protein, partial [Striga hermonthica]
RCSRKVITDINSYPHLYMCVSLNFPCVPTTGVFYNQRSDRRSAIIQEIKTRLRSRSMFLISCIISRKTLFQESIHSQPVVINNSLNYELRILQFRSIISQNIITCSIILNFLNVQMSPRREPDHPAPTQATVVAQFRDYHAEKFSGQGDPRIVDEWIQGLEFIFEVMECPERYRVICAQLQLTGDARLWWNAYWSMRPGEKAGCTWEMFKELIREKYYPTDYRAEMERQFLSLQQGTRTVDEYEREFTRLAAFVPDLVRTEAQRAQHFIDGLYPA